MKPTFTLPDLLRHEKGASRWPTPEFRNEGTDFFRAASKVPIVSSEYSRSARSGPGFFVQYHPGENVSLRLLYYPSSDIDDIALGQLGAGAHTDNGMITLLFQQDIGGVEVQDEESRWRPVAPGNAAIVINTGDPMERWATGKYGSTPHREHPKLGDVD